MSSATPQTSSEPSQLQALFTACEEQDIHAATILLKNNLKDQNKIDPVTDDIVRAQDKKTGKSALMIAASTGNVKLIQMLLQNGAVWNAVDRQNKCAGNYASDGGVTHQAACDVLLRHAVQCELLLGAAGSSTNSDTDTDTNTNKNTNQSDTSKLNLNEHGGYLDRQVEYSEDGNKLIDAAGDGVMMEWERPIMSVHAQIICSATSTTAAESNNTKRILNVGFGMGIIDTILQADHKPSLHVIIEAHPTVYEKMVRDGWTTKPNVRVCFGKWQDELPKLIEEGIQFDGVFFDTYGEHWSDMEEFHQMLTRSLVKPHGIYSFFNGLSPDNIFFHGVACECARIQMAQLGLNAEFAPCEVKVDDSAWEGVTRKYWFGDTYYLPICTWDAR